MTNESLRLGNVSLTSRKLRTIILSLFVLLGIGNVWGADLATWGKISISANTAYKASGGTAANNGKASFSSTKAMTSTGTNAYYGSSAGGAVITFSNLNLSGYISIQITFYSRASQSGTMNLEYSTNGGTTWTTGGSTTLNGTESLKTLSGIPTAATNLRLTHSKTTGSLYFGTVKISGTAAPNKTATWYVNGEVTTAGSPTTSVAHGAKVTTLPTSPTAADCDGSKVFAGWSTSEIDGETNTPPTILFTSAAESPALEANTNFYAVFGNQVSAGGSAATWFNITTYTSTPTSWTNNSVGTGSYFLFDAQNDALTSPLCDPLNSVQVTCSIATYGSGDNNNLTVQLLDKDGNVKDTKTTETPTSSSYIGSGTLSFGKVTYPFKIKFIYTATSGRGVRLQAMKCTGTTLPTYNAYATTCIPPCEELGSINGSFF